VAGPPRWAKIPPVPSRFAFLALITGLAAASACVKGSTTQTPPPASSSAGDQPDDSDSNPEPDADTRDDADTSDDALARGPTLPDGAACDSDADCGTEEVCEGLGCGAGEGRCDARERVCTRDLALYCGCDGVEFQASGSCPGARFAYRGPCEPGLEDGEACADGRQCRSGQCLGEGLEGCASAAGGVCGQQACTRDLMTYCGCNGVEFRASGTCPDRQFAYRGPCEVAEP